MSLEGLVSYCLASQQIREAIKKGKIIGSSINESRIQPSSFEPTIGNKLFILDTETTGLFRGNSQETIYHNLLKLPKRQRERINIENGFELKKTFTYLIPLNEKVRLDREEFIKSSPKSSLGRLFLNTRLLGDNNPCFDELSFKHCENKEINLYLLVQPLAFNIIAYPNLALNQLRFFKGFEAQLNPSQLIEELKKFPILYTKDSEGNLIPTDPMVTDGLEIHLNLSGAYTEGIIGLRARHNPTPIDLSKTKEYKAEDFFEPIEGKGKIVIKEKEHYLLASSEILVIPPHLNAEMRSYSHIGLNGPLHFAGFVDNRFGGDLVFEVRSDEISKIELIDGMPVSKLDLYKTPTADKLYGPSIDSHYQGQTGPRPSKHFRDFDYVYAARNHNKLDRLVLVQEAGILNSHRKNKEGFEFLSISEAQALFKDINNGFFQSRYDCESDNLILQPIPYVLLFGPDGTVFSYVRAENIKDYGDERLFGKHSIGLGGHIIKSDAPDFIENCLEREVLREEIKISGGHDKPKFVGTLMAYDKPVDQVHFGLIFSILVNGTIDINESSIKTGRMISINELIDNKNYLKRYETWSKLLIPHLAEIYKKG